jgi:hypothetical protein
MSMNSNSHYLARGRDSTSNGGGDGDSGDDDSDMNQYRVSNVSIILSPLEFPKFMLYACQI